MTPLISVVITTYRRPLPLLRCLDALLGQDMDPVLYEVVVVDDESSDLTRDRVEALQATAACTHLRYLAKRSCHRPQPGLAGRSGPNHCLHRRRLHPRPWVAGLRASRFRRGRGRRRRARDRAAAPAAHRLCNEPHRPRTLARFVTANCFYTRQVLDAGGFDELFPLPWREDSDLHFTLIERGAVLVDAPEAIVEHPARDAAWGVSIGEQHKSMYNALRYKKHPDLYQRHVQPSPRSRYYGAVAAPPCAVYRHRPPTKKTDLRRLPLLPTPDALFRAQRLRHTSRQPAHVAEMLATSAVIPVLSIYWRPRGALRYRVVFF